MKSALITGGTKGIGLEVALTLQKAGYKPVINYFNDDLAAETVCNKYGFTAIKGNVADYNEAKKIVDTAIKVCGKIEVLVNCAGIALPQKILPDIKSEDIDKCIGVNLLGTIYVSKLVLNHMITNQNGVIINMSSVFGNTGGCCEAVYSASKGGINAFTKALAKEAAAANVRVNAVAPGFVDTNMNAHLNKSEVEEFCDSLLIKRAGNVSDVAKAVMFLIENTYITGAVIPVDGGMI